MTTILMERIEAGDVLEVRLGENVVTMLVLLATEEFVVLDPCTGATPVVFGREDLVEYRKFDIEPEKAA